ncbi:hypothetical protein M408DRAFT_209239 [Serendipita vermifera MAFF 305830]|uniref:Uncharacterized protein n=1 Tax=Serendipita vermifera MAFF 305830 TaxID=933852 RepID=A0A0C3B291_SERVB|nr:hypothetical protein M408DRAFT_209239 [Serendipita vermifera MAFF 305830]
MSFSYGSIPPPESPPLRATPLSPAPPARADRRTKRHTAIDLNMAGLSLNDDGLANDPLDLNTGRRSDSSSSSGSSKRPITAIPVPKMINPLPPHYRHPSPAPSSQSTASVPSLASTHESSASSAASIASSRCSLAPKASKASLHHQDSSVYSSADSLSSAEPATPTTSTFSLESRSREQLENSPPISSLSRGETGPNPTVFPASLLFQAQTAENKPRTTRSAERPVERSLGAGLIF